MTREYSRIFLKVILVLENLSKVNFWTSIFEPLIMNEFIVRQQEQQTQAQSAFQENSSNNRPPKGDRSERFRIKTYVFLIVINFHRFSFKII